MYLEMPWINLSLVSVVDKQQLFSLKKLRIKRNLHKIMEHRMLLGNAGIDELLH